MNKKHFFMLLFLSGSMIFTTVNAQILISGFMANPAPANDAPYEYVQLIATQNINFATTSYSVVWATNGIANSSGWIQGGTVTYGFDLTSGTVNKGDVFYVGGDGKMINGAGSTDISSQIWIRAINTLLTTGDGFGANGPGQMGNGGASADGLAVFAGTTQNLTATSIPIDAVFYGNGINTAKPATGGYTLPDNDHYSNSQGTFGNGTNTFMLPSPTANNSYIKLIGTYLPTIQQWDVIRTGRIITLTATSPVSTIATGIILDDPKPGIYLSASKSGASYINQNSTNNILQAYRIEVKDMAAILDTMKINLGGTFAQSDINNIKLIYSKDAFYQTTDSIIKTVSVVNSGVLSFDHIGFTLDSASIGYLLIAIDISSSATTNNTIFVDSAYFKDFIFQLAKFYGYQPLPAGGERTIIPSGAANITATYLNDFGSIDVGTTSTEQVFTMSGSDLSPASGNIMVIPSPGFRVSFTSGSGYSSSTISKAYTSSTLSSVNVYVVFKPVAYNNVSSSITLGGGGASPVYIPVSGTGTSSDHTGPVVDTAYAVSLSKIKIVFNEAVSSSAEVLTNYQITGGVSSAIRTASLDTVYLTLNTALQPAVATNLLIRLIRDTCINQNAMLIQTFQVKYGQIIIKNYNIKDVTSINATTGVADSVKIPNVYCRLTGVIQSPNFTQNANNSMFYIHDNTDGILVNRTGAVPVFNVRRGDKVRVIGRIQQNNGLTRITADSIVIEDSLQQQRTPTVSAKLNENTEAEVIRLNNLRLINAAQWPVNAGPSRNVNVTNGTDTFTITIFTRCNIQGTPVPSSLFDIIGLGSQTDNSLPYLSGYTIWPRDLNDLIIHPPYPTYTIAEVHGENSTSGVADSIGIYCKLVGVVHGLNDSKTGLSFTIIDKTGGINVFNSINTNPPYTVTEGDEVAVIGTIQQYFGLTEIYPDTIKIISPGQSLTSPVVVDVLNESTESKLVQIKNLSIVPPSQWPVTAINNIVDVEVTDGAHNYMVRINKNCDIQGTPLPDGKFDVSGIGSQYDPNSPYTDNYYIIPRYKTEITKYNGIKESVFLNNVNLFPNPTNGSFFIQNRSDNKLIIEIFNTFGQSVYKTNSVQNLQQIDLISARGLYLVKVTDANSTESKTMKIELK